MTLDDREESGGGKPDPKPARQLRLSDLLRGPFDIKSVALTGLFVLSKYFAIISNR